MYRSGSAIETANGCSINRLKAAKRERTPEYLRLQPACVYGTSQSLFSARRLVPATIRTDLRKTGSAPDTIDTALGWEEGVGGYPAESFAISAKLARTVRNAILLAGYELKQRILRLQRLRRPVFTMAEFEMNAELRSIVLIRITARA